MDDLVLVIQDCLTPDLLKPTYRKENTTNPMYGHCYVASETAFYFIWTMMFGDKYINYRPYQNKDSSGISHWWLQNDSKEILDITAAQYTSKGLTPPYANGVYRSFLTKLPSNRAQIVIDRVIDKIK